MPYPLEKCDIFSDCETDFEGLSDESNRCRFYVLIMNIEILGHTFLLLLLNGIYRGGDIPLGHLCSMAIHSAVCVAFNFVYVRIRRDKKYLSTIIGFEMITATLVGVISVLMYSGTLVYDPAFVNFLIGKFQ